MNKQQLLEEKYSKTLDRFRLNWKTNLAKITQSCVSTLMRRINDGIVDIEAYRYAYFLYRNEFAIDKERTFPPYIPITRGLDRFTIEFIKDNPNCKILNVACGFCTRYYRISQFIKTFTWVDLDVPIVIKLRKEADNNLPLGSNHSYVGRNILSYPDVEDYDLVIAESFIYHLNLQSAKKLVARCKRFMGNVLKEDEELGELQKWPFNSAEWEGYNLEIKLNTEENYKIIFIENV